MRRLSVGQRKYIANIFGNLSVAWFVGTVITPLFALYTGISLDPEFQAVEVFGIINSVINLTLGFALVKGIQS